MKAFNFKIQFLFFFILFASGKLFSQEIEARSWNDVTLKYKFSDKLSQVGDFGFRSSLNRECRVFYIRPGIKWQISPVVNAVGGAAFFYYDSPSFDNISDFRIYQAFNLKFPKTKYFSVTHRLMTEQRWFFENGSQTSFKLRGRYRIGLKSAKFKLLGQKSTNYFGALVEVLDNIGSEKDYLPCNGWQRYTFLVGHQFSDKVSAELHYQLHGLNETAEDNYKIIQQIFRFRLFFSLKNK